MSDTIEESLIKSMNHIKKLAKQRDDLLDVCKYVENKIYILENTKGAVSKRCKKDLLKMKTQIKAAIKLCE